MIILPIVLGLAQVLVGCGPSKQSPAPGKKGGIQPIARAKCAKRPVSRPMWESAGFSGTPAFDFSKAKSQQAVYLSKFRAAAASQNWNVIHNDHFDWWQFPIDYGNTYPAWRLKGEGDIATLRKDAVWFAGYLESVRLVSEAFGWDVEGEGLAKTGGSWEPSKDIRLAKMIRSLWLFGEKKYL